MSDPNPSHALETNHSLLEENSGHICQAGVYLDRVTTHYRDEVYALQAHFGNPSTDEVADAFRKGRDGYLGFEEVYRDLDDAVEAIRESYAAISVMVVQMSTNIKDADWVNMLNVGAVQELIEFSSRDNPIAVPTTMARRD
ncbi:hypothetical protein [Nonomuraea sp. B1E8]|uniref:hypothetical protein n=1 Tax=unclassified Nonomuraea TaxID=2593643 RepID=UPI00325F2624